jgi:hypothetical protein
MRAAGEQRQALHPHFETGGSRMAHRFDDGHTRMPEVTTIDEVAWRYFAHRHHPLAITIICLPSPG